jgi:hypothetical protein
MRSLHMRRSREKIVINLNASGIRSFRLREAGRRTIA